MWRQGVRVSWLSLNVKVDDFLRFGFKTGGNSFLRFDSKLVATVSPGLASKSVAQVFWFGPQNRQLWFGDLGLKISMTFSWFGPQNQAGYGLSVAPQNRLEDDGVGHTSRSNSLLRVEASRVRVFQSGLKTDRDTTAGGARGTIMEVASRTS
jgi:hypothetical protein